MSPTAITILLLAGWGLFAWSARRRWKLMMIGRPEGRGDNIGQRVKLALRFAIGQARMPRYQFSGLAHVLVFSGFIVLLLRSLILWGRGYSEDFNFWLFAPTQPLGMAYAVLKDTFVLLVILGTCIFFYYRLVKRLPRLTLNLDGVIILAIIFVMMLADVLYDAAHMAQADHEAYKIEYAGYILHGALTGLSSGTLSVLEHIGFWTHTSLVLIFVNILPYSKHFHIITAVPNVFAADLTPRGRLTPIEDMEGKIEREETLGVATIQDLSWKGILDLYTCTECGRCSDVCPATSTGKLLSPKHLAVDLRDHLYARQDEVMSIRAASFSSRGSTTGADDPSVRASARAEARGSLDSVPLVSMDLINPEVLWACTTCRACEEECPVFITFVDKIVDLRRNLVMERAEFPDELQNLFRGLETSGNPWSYPADDRLKWTEGLDIPLIADHPDAEVLFWVGCAGAFDARAQKVTIATAKLLKHAGVNFAILGLEETCTGDPARRAGNEFLFQMMAEQNCETFKGHNIKRIITTCPHCFNTLKNEYPDFGGRFEVVHHTDFLLDLVRRGKLKPQKEVAATVAYHDSCYLGRYNDIYDSPREILRSIPGVTVVEPEDTRDRGMCCGAGGAQMFKEEEEGDQRVNAVRTGQLLSALDIQGAASFSSRGPTTGVDDSSLGASAQAEACGSLNAVASACPFCMRMLSDGIADKEREDVRQLDVAEVLCESVLGKELTAETAEIAENQ